MIDAAAVIGERPEPKFRSDVPDQRAGRNSDLSAVAKRRRKPIPQM
jgi:hypothetical protein